MNTSSQSFPARVPESTPDTQPSDGKRTFSVALETRPSVARHMIDGEEGVFVIRADPLTTKRPGGGTSIAMGFPVLLVSSWVSDPEEFAAKVAALLQEAQL